MRDSPDADDPLDLQGRDPLAPDAGEPADILEDVRDFLARFCVFPSDHALTAVTLWAAHSHLAGCFYTSPRLAVLAPERATGKTRVLEVLSLLIPESLLCLSASPASIFRTLSKGPLTLLLDECDTIFNQRGKDDANEDLRALLNAGYKRGATIPRCVGPRHDVQNFNVFCPAALAGIGRLPDTILSRSIIIRMRRRAPDEAVEPFRARRHDALGHDLRDRLALWAEGVAERAAVMEPNLPAGCEDRAAECWEPLIIVADLAGGHWPETARAACAAFMEAPPMDNESLGTRLLRDLRTIFGDALALHSQTIIESLNDPEANDLDGDAPWPELYGRGLSKLDLAKMLKAYSVAARKVKVDGVAKQGYRRDDLFEAWRRYLPAEGEALTLPAEPEPPEPMERAGSNPLFNNGLESGDGVPAARPGSASPEPAGTFFDPAGTAPEPKKPNDYAGLGPAGATGSGGSAFPGRESACPACAGEGCAWCARPAVSGGAA